MTPPDKDEILRYIGLCVSYKHNNESACEKENLLFENAIEFLEKLDKENAELNCQMKRNIYCYSCANATERCFRNEIGCPCGKYKSYKNENAELKCFIRDLIYENHNRCFQFSNTTCLFNSDYRNRAEELIGEKL